MTPAPRPGRALGRLAIAALMLASPVGQHAAVGQDAAACRQRLEVAQLYGPYADFARTAELLGVMPLRFRSLRTHGTEVLLRVCDDTLPWGGRVEPAPVAAGLSIRVLPVQATAHFNSAYPRDRNNGTLWAGRGLAGSAVAGARARWGWLSAQVAPVLAYQQNQEFELWPSGSAAEYSPYAYRGHLGQIDWPQRFGEDPFATVDPGQSFVRLDTWHMKVGVSTENLWWGPALHQPLLIGNSGPGFPHAFFGTSEPVDIWIGRFALDAFWGRIEESDYFDADPDNDHRLLAGLTLAFEPRGFDGLVLGVGRSYLRLMEEDASFVSYVTQPYEALFSNPDDDNQILGVFARWAFPSVGFELYGEWTREDAWLDLTDLAAEPDHSLGYVIGFQKATDLTDSWLTVQAELFRLQIGARSDRSSRYILALYTHDDIPQGYTHRGQLLGAGVGPGSNGGRLGVEWYTRWGMTQLHVEHVAYDLDAYYARFVIQGGTDGTDSRDWEVTVGARQLYFLGPVDIIGAIGWSHRNNRSFIGLSSGGAGQFTENNFSLELGLRWSPYR